MPKMGSAKPFDAYTNTNGWQGFKPPYIEKMYGAKAVDRHTKKHDGVPVPVLAGFDITL